MSHITTQELPVPARPGYLEARSAAGRSQGIIGMSAATTSTFKVGLVQMRSGLDPQANLAALLTAIDEAKRGGADYVQSPEMTNILALKREQLFANIVAEEHDPTLATLREVARKASDMPEEVLQLLPRWLGRQSRIVCRSRFRSCHL